jgi:hypothetical protein
MRIGRILQALTRGVAIGVVFQGFPASDIGYARPARTMVSSRQNIKLPIKL